MSAVQQAVRALRAAVERNAQLRGVAEARHCDAAFDGGEFSSSFDYGEEQIIEALYVSVGARFGLSGSALEDACRAADHEEFVHMVSSSASRRQAVL